MGRKSAYLIPSLSHLFFIIIFTIVIMKGDGLLLDGDTGYHIRAGDYIVEKLSVPKEDIFSYINPPLKWTAHEWLAEVMMSIIHKHTGMNGIVIFYSILIAFSFYLFLKLLNSNYKNILLVWTIVFFATTCTMFHWLARPHIFSFLFLIFYSFILDSLQYKNKNYLFFLPIIMLFWVNLHGGFVLGFVVLLIYIFGNLFYIYKERYEGDLYKLRLFLYTTIACGIVCLINPIGYKIFLFPFKIYSNEFLMTHIQEFMPTNFQNEVAFRYFLCFSFATLMISRKKVNIIELVLIMTFCYIALKSVRQTSLYAIVAAPILIKHLDHNLRTIDNKFTQKMLKSMQNIERANGEAKGYLWIYLVILAVSMSSYAGYLDWGFDPKKKPVEAVEFLMKEKIEGNMFNNDEFGDYLIYAAYPEYKVLFDGRSDMYGEEHFSKYLKVTRAEYGWEKIIEEFKIGWIFFDAKSFLSRYLEERKDWHLVYADKVAHIYVRNDDSYKNLIEKYPDVKPVPYEDESLE